MIITCAVCGLQYTAVIIDGKMFPREHKRQIAKKSKYVREMSYKICEGSHQFVDNYQEDHTEPYGYWGPSTE